MERKHNPKLTANAKQLRKDQTKEERHLWYDFLHNYPIRFLRQKVIDRYIVDFYCHKAKLVVELDGSQHYEDAEKAYDQARTVHLEERGLLVLRIPNNAIKENFAGVCEYIDRVVGERVSPRPSVRTGAPPFRQGGLNNKEQMPYGHYLGRFAGADPQEMAARTGCKWENGEIYVTLLGSRYAISHPEGVFRGASELSLTTRTFLLRYLLEGKNLTPTGKWLTFRQMPWGEVYAAPYSGRVLKRAAFSLATRLSAFAQAAQKLGFAPVTAGDCGCQAQLLPGYFIRILLWEGDEEFPPSAQLLYSDNFAQGFTAEDRVVAADILISVLQANL